MISLLVCKKFNIYIYILNNKLYDIHDSDEFAKVCPKFIDYSKLHP